jgi:hypothetical protein
LSSQPTTCPTVWPISSSPTHRPNAFAPTEVYCINVRE